MNFNLLPMSRRSVVSILGLLPFVLSAQNPTGHIATWKNDADGAYTIVHDDYGDTGVDGIWQYADTICSNRGISFTFGAIASRCEDNRNINGYSSPYSYAKNVMMAQHNHEIMSHSHTHDCAVGNAGWSPCDLPVGDAWGEDVNGANFNMELVTAHNSITTNTGFAPKYYIYPYDRFTDAANNKLKELDYLGSRTGWTSPRAGDSQYHRNGYDNSDENTFFPDADGFFRTSVEVFDDVDANKTVQGQISELNGEVDNAINTKMWANRELHNVGNSGWGAVSVDAYRAHINYLQTKINSGELWVGTVSELMTYQMQKLKYSPNVVYNNAADQVEVSWTSINGQYNVNMNTYLTDLTVKSPITLVVDLDGLNGSWLVDQNGTNITDFWQYNGSLYINVYPVDGNVVIYKSGVSPNQAPYVENAISDYNNLMVDFSDFTIDLKDVFGDNETSDQNLIYTYSGNSNIGVSISNGVATISSTNGWSGAESITFTVEDQGGLTVSDVVSFNVIDLFVGQTPYGGSFIPVPGVIESENYDVGGEGISFHEVNTNYEPDPQDNPYRPNTDPDIEEIIGVGYGLSYTEDNEWLEYSIDVTASGWYNVRFNISQELDQWNTPVGQIKLDVDNQAWMPTQTMKYTTSWTDYEDVVFTNSLFLSQGKHLLKLEFVSGSVNIDHLEIMDSPVNSAADPSVDNYNIYPNPARSVLNLEGDFEEAVIFNQVGEVVMKTTSSKVQLDGIAEGVYYVKFNNANGMLKFVKTK